MDDYMKPNSCFISQNDIGLFGHGNPHNIGCFQLISYLLAIAIVLSLCVMLGSCRSHKEIIENNDSIQVVVQTNTIYVPDTVYVKIPAQVAERTTADSISHLENDYAQSDARINPDGTLFHSLETKPQSMPVEFQKPIVTKDSIKIHYKTRTKTIEVEKKLSKWEKFKMDTGLAFIVATLVLGIGLVVLLIFRFRNKI